MQNTNTGLLLRLALVMESITLSKIRQTSKHNYCCFLSYMVLIGKKVEREHESRQETIGEEESGGRGGAG